MRKAPLILLILIGFNVHAQSPLKLDNSSDLTVSGTSTLHDWTIVAEEISGNASFAIVDGNLQSISNLSIKVKVTEIKSGKSGMDNNTYKALNASKYPFITFSLNSASATKSGSNYQVKESGNLTVAGVTKPITVMASCTLSGTTVVCKGSYTMKMTEFNVEPPTAMFGTIKTGDEVTIDYNVKFINSELSKL